MPIEAPGESLIPMRDGSVAVIGFDEIMREIDVSGAVTSLGAMPAFSGVQTALGVWTGLSYADNQVALTARLGPPVDPPVFSHRVEGGNPRQSSAPELLSFVSPDQASLKALDFVEPISATSGVEWGGKICKQGNRYLFSRFVTSHIQNSVQVDQLAHCEPDATWGRFHTHPPLELAQPSADDLSNANARPDLVFYLLAPIPNSPVFPPISNHRLRYRAVPNRPANDNTCERVGQTWQPYMPLSPNAVCSSHLP